ncbi:MAG: rod shape-determining protein MreD [Elusimicrobiota bacterium]|nr:rod shape-determining protein MreD [Elusimicrobiota bacterium]
MTFLRSVALYFGAMLLQWWWNTHFSYWGAAPQFLLVATLLIASRRGPVPAMLAGFGWGLFLDVSRAELFGASAFLLTGSAYLAGMVRKQIDLRAAGPLAVCTMLVTLGALLTHGLLGLVFNRAFEHFAWRVWVFTPVMNALLAGLGAVLWDALGADR